jgi:predicted phage tail protein
VKHLDLIRGAGGGGGGGGESNDTLRSTQTADVLDLISEGECEGLVNGLKSVYFDGVPLQAADGSYNFQGWDIATTPGTQGQASIAGADGVQNEVGVGVEVKFATPIVRTITNPAIDTCRVTIIVPQLSKSDGESGDLGGNAFSWAVAVQSAGGGYVQMFSEVVRGKTMSRYPRAKTFKLPGSAPWNIRVERSPDSTSASDVQGFSWSTYTEIQSLKLRYPNSAMVRTRINAEQFSRIPVRSFDWMGMRIKVPLNYDPKTRVYTGIWNGSFKIAWTDNPAWIFYDMVVNNRYGLGRYIATTDAFKWELYAIGRYCDELVPDGYGGQEPRFRASPVLQTREQAYKVLTDLAGIFRGMAYWQNADVAVIQDAPSDPVAVFTPANVVQAAPGRAFSYTGASNSKRYSQVVVWFNSLPDRGKLVPEIVIDDELESRIGVKTLQLTPLGIWSRGQAQRIGNWVIYTQQNETGGVVFNVGLDGVLLAPGRVFQIADPNEAGERLAGRVHAATTTHVTLDAEVTLAAGESYVLSVMLQDPADPAKLVPQKRAVTTAAGTTREIDLAAALTSAPAAESVWMLQSNAIAPTTWRCIGVKENDDNTFTISGLAHAPQKYALIEQGIRFERTAISRVKLVPEKPTDLLVTETPYLQGSITKSRVTISWRVPAQGLSFLVSWRLNGGPWTQLPSTSVNAVDVDGLAKGLLDVTVQSRNAIGNDSTPLEGSATLLGKTRLPLSPTGFAAEVVQGGVKFTWNASQADDYLTNTLKIGSSTIFEGAASSWTWAWPAPGSYTVSLTEWDTSIHESVAVGLTVTVDSAMLLRWASVTGKPKLFRVAARGFNDSSAPIYAGLFDGESGAAFYTATRSYMLARIRRSDGAVVFFNYYDVFAAGTDAGNPLAYGRGAAELASALNASGSDVIVVVWTTDEPKTNRLTAGLAAAMYRCGASRAIFGSPEFKARSAYVLVGIGGCGEGQGFEAYNGTVDSDTNAWCDVAFALNNGNLLITGSGATPRSLADYSYTGDLNATSDVQLTGRGVKVSGNNLVKLGGAAAWDSDAYSRDRFSGSAFASASPAQADAEMMFGLNSDPLTDASYTSLDYAWYMSTGGGLSIWESGVNVLGGLTYVAGDALAVLYDGANIGYQQNGVVRRKVTVGAGLAFGFDSSFYGPGAALNNVRFGPMSAVTEIETPQIAPGAATTPQQASSAFGSVTDTTTTGFDPVIVATTLSWTNNTLGTVVVQVEHAVKIGCSASGSNGYGYAFHSYSVTGGGGAGSTVFSPLTANDTPDQASSYVATVSVGAGLTVTVQLNVSAHCSLGGSVTCTYSNASSRVTAIKR